MSGLERGWRTIRVLVEVPVREHIRERDVVGHVETAMRATPMSSRWSRYEAGKMRVKSLRRWMAGTGQEELK